MDVIGVIHVDKYALHLEQYIRQNYAPGTIMLELDPNNKPEGYFGILEEKLKDDWRVIRGDKYHNYNSEFAKFKTHINNIETKLKDPNFKCYSTLTEGLLDLGYLASAPVRQRICMLADVWNFKSISKRNQGFYETINERFLDVAIVGAAHAFAIKKEKPDIYFKLFLIDAPISYISEPITQLFSKIYGTSPDEVIWYPRKNLTLEK
jgi:hypothetical protein